jgi:hypothetical protein
VGFEPTTFRLRARCSASNWTALVGSCLLTSGSASVWSSPDAGVHLDRMIIGMIKRRSILDRIAPVGRTPRQWVGHLASIAQPPATPVACHGGPGSNRAGRATVLLPTRPMNSGHNAADLTQQVPTRRVVTSSWVSSSGLAPPVVTDLAPLGGG